MTFTGNRQNVLMARPALIATIFLPLSYLVGFFAENFSQLVQLQTGWRSFIILGPRAPGTVDCRDHDAVAPPPLEVIRQFPSWRSRAPLREEDRGAVLAFFRQTLNGTKCGLGDAQFCPF